MISKGEPMTLAVTPDQPTFTDPNATIAWSQGLEPSVKVDANLSSLKVIFGTAHGEPFQLAFQGKGWVMVSPVRRLPLPPWAGHPSPEAGRLAACSGAFWEPRRGQGFPTRGVRLS